MCFKRLSGQEHNAGFKRQFKAENRVKGSSVVIVGGSAKLYAVNLISLKSLFGKRRLSQFNDKFLLQNGCQENYGLRAYLVCYLGKRACRMTLGHSKVSRSSLLLRNTFTTIPCINTHFLIMSESFRFKQGFRRFTGKEQITWASGTFRSKTRAWDSS